MTAYVLVDSKSQLKDRDQLDLYDGYLNLGLPTKLIKESEIYSGVQKVTKSDTFCGHINLCHFILNENKVPIPESLGYPEELKSFYGRNITQVSFRNFEESFKDDQSYFIKPLRNKLFEARIVSSIADLKVLKSSIEDSTMIYVSDVVSFKSEYRFYIFRNEIVDFFKYYVSDWKDSFELNLDVVEDIFRILKSLKMPVFYSLDVGTDSLGRTLIVELNDGYALGNYGLAPLKYTQMSMERWEEINKD